GCAAASGQNRRKADRIASRSGQLYRRAASRTIQKRSLSILISRRFSSSCPARAGHVFSQFISTLSMLGGRSKSYSAEEFPLRGKNYEQFRFRSLWHLGRAPTFGAGSSYPRRNITAQIHAS